MLRQTTALLFLAAVSAPGFAHDPKVPATIDNYKFDHVTKHIHVIHGPLAHPGPENHGFMNNPAAIVTDEGVIVVDPGSSTRIGKQVLGKIRALTPKPVIAVLNTHVHGDHWLGNDAIRQAYPKVPIYAHEKMIRRVQAGAGEYWISVFEKMTAKQTAGTKVAGPTVGLKGGEVLTLGGIKVRVHHAGHAHTDHDLLYEVLSDQALFMGDVVVAHHVPHSDVPQDANFKGAILAVENILKGQAKTFIPGHGRTGGREVPESTLRFQKTLTGLVTKYYLQGKQADEMTKSIVQEMSEYRTWHNFSEMGKVISFVYLEVERDNF